MKKVINLIQRFIFKFSNKYTIQDILSKNTSSFPKSNRKNISLFINKGTSCVSCGDKGVYFKKTKNSYHLYTKDGTLMTKDHIYPKSKGGRDNLYNLQPMCYKCNSDKADIIPEKGSYFFIKHNKEKYLMIKRIKNISKLVQKTILSEKDQMKCKRYIEFLYEKKIFLLFSDIEIEDMKKIPLNTFKGIEEINKLLIQRIH